jgi:eukaryotic-like serine/threonine-protein kinase
MTVNSIIIFKKYLKEIGVLGRGSTGDTRLFEDVFTGWKYAVKKFQPYDETERDELFIRFINEIKILAGVNHPNIVRFYDFYLYPEKTGFIKMEYVEGSKICDFDFHNSTRTWDRIFIDLIDAFSYLEESGVLHRDIRFENILIDSKGIPKVIDFGFGKLNYSESSKTSEIIETPFYEDPEEIVTRGTYNHGSEIFYLGKMFQKLGLLENPDFNYKKIVTRMRQYYENQRYKSFKDIKEEINLKYIEMKFSKEQKQIYLNFADCISNILISHEDNIQFFEDYDTVINNLKELLRKSILEDYLQKSADLLNCFVENGFSFNQVEVSMEVVRNFYDMLTSEGDYKKHTIIDNINTRIRSKPISYSLPNFGTYRSFLCANLSVKRCVMAKSKWDQVKSKLHLVEKWARDGLREDQIAKNLGISVTTFRSL